MPTFTGDLSGPSTNLPHFWEHTVGSGNATLALRADWQAQMKRTHDELGMKHVRFHGILSDGMGTCIGQDNQYLYSFFNADQIFDFLLSIGMKPFVELSFMPSILSSGDQIIFRYRANVTPPRDHADWAVLIRKLVGHWVDRYGVDEVRQWFFEVWNEPNLLAFGDGKQDTYFKLYRYTVEAIKGVDTALRVGGPATAENAWVADFIAFCKANGLPADFVSTHHYPTDAFGMPGDDTITQLAKSTRSILREQTRAVRKQAGDLPVYYTEWCTSSNPRDFLHDDPYAAAFIVKTVLEANGLVQGYSYWTFSDIFEENYFPSVPFHGGFGLLNLHGIAKPAYRAYQLLHGLGTDLMPVEGKHETVDAWLVRGERVGHPHAHQLRPAPSSHRDGDRVVRAEGGAVRRRRHDPAHRSGARQRQAALGAAGQARISERRDGGRAGRRLASSNRNPARRARRRDISPRGDDAASSGRRHSACLLAPGHGRADQLVG